MGLGLMIKDGVLSTERSMGFGCFSLNAWLGDAFLKWRGPLFGGLFKEGLAEFCVCFVAIMHQALSERMLLVRLESASVLLLSQGLSRSNTC